MPVDLRRYIVAKTGKWHTNHDCCTADQLILSPFEDSVTLSGPLNISIVQQTSNLFVLAGSSQQTESFHEVYSYNLSIPAGHLWSYPQVPTNSSLVATAGDTINVASPYRIIIRPPLAAPQRPVSTGDDIPCGYGVSSIRDTSQFFPSPCEGCPPGSSINMPPGTATTLTAPADGGCSRPRYYNGMLVTREDLDAEQRYFRLKNKMQNRAMGAGVVWGFRLGKTSSGICVQPGYGVDCCGNDIILTEQYHVTSEALLRDPLAIQYTAKTSFRGFTVDDECSHLTKRPPKEPPDRSSNCRRMHLLLEYVECPEQPRPVHGDACSTQSNSCEMSRIRETTRLRLVPPRDYDPTGPIDKFLAIFQDVLASRDELTTSPAAAVALPTLVPIEVRLVLSHGESIVLDMNLNQKSVSAPLRVGPAPQAYNIEVAPKPGYRMTAGLVTRKIPVPEEVVATADITTTPLTWSDDPLDLSPESLDRVFYLNDLSISSSEFIVTGDADVSVIFHPTTPSDDHFGDEHSRNIRLVYDAYLVINNALSAKAVKKPARLLCLDESCSCGDGPPRFPVMPPFLHEDPAHPGQAIDWKILLVAAAYSFLAMQEQQGNPHQVGQARELYQAVKSLVFGKKGSPDDDARLTKGIMCLLREWCCTLLYPGPVCSENPHGVVIGCATVRGSEIVDVDPWGGRRWVLHYPLLSYWGHQFGIVPPDVFASRLFGLICCISRLPPFDGRLQSGSHEPLSLGNLRLFTARSPQLNASLETEGIRVTAEHHVSMPEFVVKLFTNLQSPETNLGTTVEVFRPKDAPDLAFVVPAAQPVHPVVKGVTVSSLVRSTAATTQRAIPLLMRATTENIATNLASAVSLSSTGVSKEILKQAHGAKLETVADVLDADPDRLLSVFGTPAAVNEVVAVAENKVVGLTDAVYKSAAAADARVQSPEDLKDSKRFAKYSAALLTSAVKEALKVKNPQAMVNTVIESALKKK